MASERPICECGHEWVKHGGGRCVGYVGDDQSCPCLGYCPAPDAPLAAGMEAAEKALAAIQALPAGVSLRVFFVHGTMQRFECTTDDLKSLAALREENARLRTALEHYADDGTWIKGDDDELYERYCTDLGNGYDIARAALTDATGGEGE